MKRPSLAGWRERRGLGLVTVDGWSWDGAAALVQALKQDRLNLPLVLLHQAGGTVAGGVALERAAAPQAAATARRLAREQGWPEPAWHVAVSALILYPLAGRLALPASALAVLAGAGLTPLAMATSPAALKLIMTDEDMPRATGALAAAWDLPPSPQSEALSVVQSESRRET